MVIRQLYASQLLAFAAPFALTLTSAEPALAACAPGTGNVSCTGATFDYNSGVQDGLNVTVQSRAAVIGMAASNYEAIRIENGGRAGNTLTNNGTIDGFVVIQGFGFDSFTNNGVLSQSSTVRTGS